MAIFAALTSSSTLTPGRKIERLTFKYANTYVMLPTLTKRAGWWSRSHVRAASP
jgi:hypothetical protein